MSTDKRQSPVPPVEAKDAKDSDENETPRVVYQVVTEADLPGLGNARKRPDPAIELNLQPTAYGFEFKSEGANGNNLDLDIGCAAFNDEGKLLAQIDAENPTLFEGGLVKMIKKTITGPPKPPPSEGQEPEAPDISEIALLSIDLENVPPNVAFMYLYVSSLDESPAFNTDQKLKDVRDTLMRAVRLQDVTNPVIEYNMTPYLDLLKGAKERRRERLAMKQAKAEHARKEKEFREKSRREAAAKASKAASNQPAAKGPAPKQPVSAAPKVAAKEPSKKEEDEELEESPEKDNVDDDVIPVLAALVWARLSRSPARGNVWTLTPCKNVFTRSTPETLNEELKILATSAARELKALPRVALTQLRIVRFEDLSPFGEAMGRCLDHKEAAKLCLAMRIIQVCLCLCLDVRLQVIYMKPCDPVL
jgi:hypothetical protein